MRKIHRDIVGTFIFSNDAYVLLGKSRKGGVYRDCWLIPGGGIEDGERRLEAARRETLEEVGIDIAPLEVALIDNTHTGSSKKVLKATNELVMVDMTFYDFVVKANKPANEIPITCLDDIAEASWHKISDLEHLKISPPTAKTLQYLGYL